MDRLECVAQRLREEPLTQDLALETVEAIQETLTEMRRLQSLPGIIAEALIQAANEPGPSYHSCVDP